MNTFVIQQQQRQERSGYSDILIAIWDVQVWYLIVLCLLLLCCCFSTEEWTYQNKNEVFENSKAELISSKLFSTVSRFINLLKVIKCSIIYLILYFAVTGMFYFNIDNVKIIIISLYLYSYAYNVTWFERLFSSQTERW